MIAYFNTLFAVLFRTHSKILLKINNITTLVYNIRKSQSLENKTKTRNK